MSDPYADVNEAVKKIYERGLLDGLEAGLRLMLGEFYEAMQGYPGPLDDSAREWAELRLEALAITKKENSE